MAAGACGLLLEAGNRLVQKPPDDCLRKAGYGLLVMLAKMSKLCKCLLQLLLLYLLSVLL